MRVGRLLNGDARCCRSCANKKQVEPVIHEDFVEIPLSQGLAAVVDKEDYERIPALRDKWCANKVGTSLYAIKSDNSGMRMGRLITGVGPGKEVDYRDGDGLNNRRSNLRVCGHEQNAWNSRPRTRKKTSQYKGVHWSRQKSCWASQIRCRGRRFHLGLFQDEEAAALAYNDAASRLFGEFAYLNAVPA